MNQDQTRRPQAHWVYRRKTGQEKKPHSASRVGTAKDRLVLGKIAEERRQDEFKYPGTDGNSWAGSGDKRIKTRRACPMVKRVLKGKTRNGQKVNSKAIGSEGGWKARYVRTKRDAGR